MHPSETAIVKNKRKMCDVITVESFFSRELINHQRFGNRSHKKFLWLGWFSLGGDGGHVKSAIVNRHVRFNLLVSNFLPVLTSFYIYFDGVWQIPTRNLFVVAQ